MIHLRGHRSGDRASFARTGLEGEFVSVPVAEHQLRLPDDPADGDAVFLDHVILCRDAEPLGLVRVDADPYRSAAFVAIQLATERVTDAELGECVSEVLLYLADVRSLEYVLGYCCDVPASRSRSLLERFGFERLGAIPQHAYAYGKLRTRELWGRTIRGAVE